MNFACTCVSPDNIRLLILSLLLCPILSEGCDSPREISYEDGYITVSEGINIYYEKIGDGYQAILIPGGMYYSPIFRQLASQDRTLIIYDQRGRGNSSSITDSTLLGWRQEVDDIESIRKFFDFETINIIGWSYSGAVAAIYANTFPQTAEQIVLIGPMPVKKVPFWQEYLQTMQSRKPGDYENKIQSIQTNFERTGDLKRYIKDSYKELHQLLLFDKSILENFREDFYTSENERPDIMWGFTFPAVIASFGEWDFTVQLNDLTTLALIIQGTYDAIPIASANRWKATIRNSRLFVMDEAGHMPFVEKQQEVQSVINDFLNGTSNRKRNLDEN